jgi:hypothetical protein
MSFGHARVVILAKTQDLTGAQLDWAVAKACDMLQPCQVMLRIDSDRAYPVDARKPDKRGPRYLPVFAPSTDWNCGGPLLDAHMIGVSPHATENGKVTSWAAGMTWPCDTMPPVLGPTLLVAACRAIVKKMLGSTVELPVSLRRS